VDAPSNIPDWLVALAVMIPFWELSGKKPWPLSEAEKFAVRRLREMGVIVRQLITGRPPRFRVFELEIPRMPGLSVWSNVEAGYLLAQEMPNFLTILTTL
jgi:hypothetical protein